MKPSRSHAVDSFSLGVPPKDAKRCVETITFIIHDFDTKMKEKAAFVSSTLFAHGCRWKISYFNEVHFASIKLHSLEKYVDASFTLRLKYLPSERRRKKFSIKDNAEAFEEIVCILEEDRSLTIAFAIELHSKSPSNRAWYPKKLQPQSILVDLYNDAASETADVVFSIGATEYYAHKSILALRCKKLYEIAIGYGENVPIPIENTSEMVFKCILEFVYTVKLPTLTTRDLAKEVLIAADFYECIQLKLYVESVIVDKFLVPENAAELLLFADSYSCALLKEKTTKRLVKDPSNLKKAKEWSIIKDSPSLLLECFEAVTSEHGYESDIAGLRDSCQKQNLEVDGSRQVLTERLQKKRKLAENKEK